MRRVLCVLLIVLLLPLASACNEEDTETLRMTVLDVGQSDCMLLSCGDAHMLVDTGTATERDAVLAQLDALGVEELAYLVVTHPHEDHYGNARVILERYTVGTLVLSPAATEELGYSMLLTTAAECGVGIKKVADGWSFSLGGASCGVLCPLPLDENVNNASLVLRVAFGLVSILLMGDVEQEGEEALMAAHGASFLNCDLLKVGHHGSDTATTQAFLALATPRLAAISCGENNDYGFPHDAVLANLTMAGASVYRTDTMGALTFVSDGREIVYEE